MQLTRKHYSGQSGVGLIEVLVSLLVIAIGVLGMAGLYSRSLQYNQAAYFHSRATFLAGDMLDRIRANSSLAKNGNNYQVSAEDHVAEDCLDEHYPDTCENADCSAEQLAIYDIQQWKFQLACEIPGATAAVSFADSTDERLYTIRISFPGSENHTPANDVLLRGVL